MQTFEAKKLDRDTEEADVEKSREDSIPQEKDGGQKEQLNVTQVWFHHYEHKEGQDVEQNDGKMTSMTSRILWTTLPPRAAT